MLWLNNRSRSDRKNVRTLRDGLRGDDEGTYIQLLDDGHLAGIGSHRELLRSCEVYREICLSQLSKEEVERDEQ